MTDRARRRTILRRGLIALALLALVVWLVQLQRKWDRAAGEIATGLTVEDLTAEVSRLRSRPDPGEHSLLQTAFGGLRLVVPTATANPTLHLRRVGHEAALPVVGELGAVHAAVVDGKRGSHTLAPGPACSSRIGRTRRTPGRHARRTAPWRSRSPRTPARLLSR